jgi:hypothetical protein
MFNSQIFDLVIGIGFVFLLLALVTSTVNELIFSHLNMRARKLLEGLQTMLADKDNGWVKKIYNHPLIAGLFQGNFEPENKKRNLPSYIPSKSFALALVDVIAAHSAEPEKARAAQHPGPSDKSGEPSINLQEFLEGLKAKAGTDSAAYLKSIEDWYNSTMDRVSGWYKFRTQQIIFVIAFVLAVIMNADVVTIGRQLSNDAALRQAMVAGAQAAVNQRDSKPGTISEQVKQINGLGLPIGWLPRDATTEDLRVLPWNLADGRCNVLSKTGWLISSHLLGWLITGIAASLGAPFWFDILNKFIVVRSTVKPEEKSKNEPSKG